MRSLQLFLHKSYHLSGLCLSPHTRHFKQLVNSSLSASEYCPITVTTPYLHSTQHQRSSFWQDCPITVTTPYLHSTQHQRSSFRQGPCGCEIVFFWNNISQHSPSSFPLVYLFIYLFCSLLPKVGTAPRNIAHSSSPSKAY